MPLPNPLYSMHVNAAVAGPSNQRLRPLSVATGSSLYPTHLVRQFGTPQLPPLPSKPPALSKPLPPSLMPGGAGHSRSGVLSTLESSLLFQPNAIPSPGPSTSSSSTPTDHANSRLYSENLSSARPALPPKPHVQTRTSYASLTDEYAPKTPPKPFYPDEKRAATTLSSPDAEEEELVARALELSLKDIGAVGQPDLEDDILARVLEESMASSGFNSSAARDPHGYREADLRQFEMGSHSSCASSSAPSNPDTPSTSVQSHVAYGDSAEKHRSNSSMKTDVKGFTKPEQDLIRDEDEARRRQLEMDEELARSIARLEASSSPSHSPLSSTSITHSAHSATTSTDTVSPRSPLKNAIRPSSFHVAALQQQIPPHPRTSLPPLPVSSASRPLPSFGRGQSIYAAGGPVHPAAPPYDRLARSVSAQAAIPTVGSTEVPFRPPSCHANTAVPVQHRRDSALSVSSPSTPSSNRPTPIPGVPTRSISTGQTIGPTPSEEEEHEALENCESPIMSPISADERDEGQLVSSTGHSSSPIVEEELLLGVCTYPIYCHFPTVLTMALL